MVLRGLLFDLDDTLYGYAPCNESALEEVFAGFGAELGLSREAFRALHDEVRLDLARELHGHAAAHNRILFFKRMIERRTGHSRPKLACAMFERYWSRFLEHMQPAPDAHDVLKELSTVLPLALVSNHTTDIQLRKVVQLGYEPYFKYIFTSEEVGAEKPSPRPFQVALDRLEVSGPEALMIGDDPQADIAAARALGIRTVLTREYTTQVAAADRIISTLAELPGIVRELSSGGSRR